MTRGKNQQTTREHNQALILSLIRDHANISRVDLSRQSRLSKPVVTSIVDNLLAAGLVEEGRKAQSTVGRRPVMLNIATDYYRMIGIDLSRDDITIVTTTLTGEIENRLSEPFDVESTNSAQQEITDLVLDMVKATKLEKERIVGIGIGHPFPLSASRKLIVADEDVNDWRAVKLGGDLKEALGVPVYLDNDANVAALYEQWYGKAQAISDFIYLLIGNGVGAGLYVDGRLILGHSGFAGEIGHITVSPNGEKCVCGKSGCLETEMSLRYFHRLVEETITSGGDLEAKIEEYARNVGRHMGNIVNVFNPQALIIGGAFADEQRIPRDIVAEAVNEAVHPLLRTTFELIFAEEQPDTVAKGAAALVALHIYRQPQRYFPGLSPSAS